MSDAQERAPAGAVLKQVLSLLRDNPGGMSVAEVAAELGKPSALMGVLLRGYEEKGRVVGKGGRLGKRYSLGDNLDGGWVAPAASPVATAVVAPGPDVRLMGGASRDAVIDALLGLLRALGLEPEDLIQSQTKPDLQQLVTLPTLVVAAVSEAPAPRLERAKKLPRTPGPKPVERRSFVPLAPTPRASASRGEVIVPEGVRVTLCPGGTDTRYAADSDAQGAGFMAEWKKLRGES